MHRFFFHSSLKSGQVLDVPRDRAHQLVRVLRLAEGDHLVIFNGEGGEFESTIDSIEGHHCTVRVGASRDVHTESAFSVRLFQCIPKKDKLELIAQKATEIGVQELIPVISRYCSARVVKREERIEKIIEEATEQSGRIRQMRLHDTLGFEQALELSQDADLRIIAWEKEQTRGLIDIRHDSPDVASIAVFVGPEGGWEETEIELALKRGVIPFSLGPRIMRTETAGIVIPALVLHEWSRGSN